MDDIAGRADAGHRRQRSIAFEVALTERYRHSRVAYHNSRLRNYTRRGRLRRIAASKHRVWSITANVQPVAMSTVACWSAAGYTHSVVYISRSALPSSLMARLLQLLPPMTEATPRALMENDARPSGTVML